MNERRFLTRAIRATGQNKQINKQTKTNKMKKLVSIKHYPSNFEIAYKEENETILHSLSYDGLKGELTREDWKEDSFIADFDEIDQDEILDYMNIFEIFTDEYEQIK